MRPDERLEMQMCFIFVQNYWVARHNTFCHWQHHHRMVSCHILVLFSSKQECRQCICYGYIQQESLLDLVAGKYGNNICESGRLRALLNQAYQFCTDFHHRISITCVLCAWDLLFSPEQLAGQNLGTSTFSSKQNCCWWMWMHLTAVTHCETSCSDHWRNPIRAAISPRPVRSSHGEVNSIPHGGGLWIWHLVSVKSLKWLSALIRGFIPFLTRLCCEHVMLLNRACIWWGFGGCWV